MEGTAGKALKQSPVSEALSRLFENIDTAHNQFEQLAAQLNPGRLHKPKADGAEKQPDEPKCELETAIRLAGIRVQSLADEMRQVREELQI